MAHARDEVFRDTAAWLAGATDPIDDRTIARVVLAEHHHDPHCTHTARLAYQRPGALMEIMSGLETRSEADTAKAWFNAALGACTSTQDLDGLDRTRLSGWIGCALSDAQAHGTPAPDWATTLTHALIADPDTALRERALAHVRLGHDAGAGATIASAITTVRAQIGDGGERDDTTTDALREAGITLNVCAQTILQRKDASSEDTRTSVRALTDPATGATLANGEDDEPESDEHLLACLLHVHALTCDTERCATLVKATPERRRNGLHDPIEIASRWIRSSVTAATTAQELNARLSTLAAAAARNAYRFSIDAERTGELAAMELRSARPMSNATRYQGARSLAARARLLEAELTWGAPERESIEQLASTIERHTDAEVGPRTARACAAAANAAITRLRRWPGDPAGTRTIDILHKAGPRLPEPARTVIKLRALERGTGKRRWSTIIATIATSPLGEDISAALHLEDLQPDAPTAWFDACIEGWQRAQRTIDDPSHWTAIAAALAGHAGAYLPPAHASAAIARIYTAGEPSADRARALARALQQAERQGE